jgi:hydrogenase expression/formation protein HypC
MCLAIPAQVLELRAPDMAWVDLAGVRKEISVALLDTVVPGDYVIVHVGFALSKLDPEEAANTLALFADLTHSENPASSDEIH